MATLIPVLTSTPGNPPTHNTNVTEACSRVLVNNDIERPMYAQVVYPIEISQQLSTIIQLLSAIANP